MEKGRLSLTEAIHVAEGYDVQNTHILDAEKILQEGLPKIPEEDTEKKAEFFYYLLTLLLRRHITFENPLAHTYFDRMTEYLQETERRYRLAYRAEVDLHKKKLMYTQQKAFYKIVERYYVTLEIAYARKGFLDAQERAYEQKLLFRMGHLHLRGRYGKWLFLALFRTTTNFGLSIGRLPIFLLIMIVGFGILFALSDLMTPAHVMVPASGHWFDYVYFSTITLTSLGYGDIVPITFIQKLIVSVEILVGYVILGLFIHYISKRL